MKRHNPEEIIDDPVNPLARIKRNVTINKKRTTLMLEQEIWTILDELAREEGLTLDELCHKIHYSHNGEESISSVLRVVAVLACRVDANIPIHDHSFNQTQMMFPSRLHQALNRLNPSSNH